MSPDAGPAAPPARPPAADPVRYSVGFAVPRVRTSPWVNALLPLLTVGLAIALIVALHAPLPVAALVVAAGTAIYVSMRRSHIISVTLATRSVTLSRGEQTYRLALSDLADVWLSELPYAGEQLEAAVAAFTVHGQHTLTLVDRAGVRYHCAIDLSNPYGRRIAQSLLRRTPPATPWEAFQDRAAKAKSKAADKVSAAADERTVKDAPRETESHATLWLQSCQQHDQILEAYGAYELDPQLLLKYPSIVDVTVDETADFFHSLSEATALRTDQFPGPGTTFESYRAAVRALTQAWARAEKQAKSAGISQLTAPDQRRISQAAKLLQHAASATSLERATYLNQARVLLDQLIESGAITPPPRMMFEIGQAAAAALESGTADS